MILLKEKTLTNPHPSEVFQIMKRDLIVFYMMVSNIKSSRLVMFIIKVLVENQILDTTTVILEITFNNYNVFFKK